MALLEAAGSRVLALDVAGCGVKRGRDVASLDAEDVARELVSDVEAAGCSDIILVGHPLAGAIFAVNGCDRTQAVCALRLHHLYRAKPRNQLSRANGNRAARIAPR